MEERAKKNKEVSKMLAELELIEEGVTLERNRQGDIVFDLNNPEQKKSHDYWLDED